MVNLGEATVLSTSDVTKFGGAAADFQEAGSPVVRVNLSTASHTTRNPSPS